MEELKEYEVKTFGEYVSLVVALSKSWKAIRWFRGHGVSSFDLKPSVWRGSQGREGERNLVHRFRARATSHLAISPGYDSSGDWLSIMQHYRLPTRLLDWSRSPMIAAYFAAETLIDRRWSYHNGGARIWILDPHKLNELQGIGSVTPPIDAHMCKPFLDPAFNEDKEEDKIIAVMASERDKRMFMQQGCFTVHSNPLDMRNLPGAADFLESIFIPEDALIDFSFGVKTCGFQRGYVYADLENLSAELKNEFW